MFKLPVFPRYAAPYGFSTEIQSNDTVIAKRDNEKIHWNQKGIKNSYTQ